MGIKRNTRLLSIAASRGDIDELRRLIPLSDCTYNNSACLVNAATFGRTECVKLLIPVCQPAKSYALYWAAYYGHTNIVHLLLPVSDPHHKQSLALQAATKNGHDKCVALLYPVSEPSIALHALKTEYPNEPDKWQLLEEREVERLHGLLHQEIGKVKSIKTKSTRKM